MSITEENGLSPLFLKNLAQCSCKGQKRAKLPKAVMDPSPRSPNNEFVESRNKS